MPYAHALLALLAERKGYAWQLRNGVEATLGGDWSGASRSHVYVILKRLLKDGLITSVAVPTADLRADITLHEITEKGRAELDEWMNTPTTRTAGYRDDFSLKVLAAAFRGVEEIRRVCDIQRQARMAELQSVHALRRDHLDDPLLTWTIEVAINHIQADLQSINSAESRAEQIVREVPKVITSLTAREPHGDDAEMEAATDEGHQATA